MQIVKSEAFLYSLQIIIEFIAKDSLNRALVFDQNLREKLNILDQYPYKFRKSIYFNDRDVRDYIFMGYIIPYLIDKNNDRIVILDIVKYRNKD